jgi:hypothetical protein
MRLGGDMLFVPYLCAAAFLASVQRGCIRANFRDTIFASAVSLPIRAQRKV